MVWDALHLQIWLSSVTRELFLFAATLFLVGAIDELAVDATWLWLRLTGRARTERLADDRLRSEPLAGPCAAFIPAWNEPEVIGATVAHALEVWPQEELRLYVGCYRNDVATIAAAMAGGAGDPRLRVVIHDRTGPSSKADCLNRLYRALCMDEARLGVRARMVVLQDAEDMVDPQALALLDRSLDGADFLQLPVLALPQRGSRFVAGHYLDEFAESHAKSMVVRSHLASGIPGAGVGMGIARPLLDRLERETGMGGPFAADSLTEDYELGLRLAALGARTRFLRVRAADGSLVATRAYFPATLHAALRQKSRWIQGISLQGWDRLGWHGSPGGAWMLWRDRRGPIAAVMLLAAYLLVLVWGAQFTLSVLGLVSPASLPEWAGWLLEGNLAVCVWRLAARAAFTTREHGPVEGLLSIPRVVVSNVVAILATRRALLAYVRALGTGRSVWEKTDHAVHPALSRTMPRRWRGAST